MTSIAGVPLPTVSLPVPIADIPVAALTTLVQDFLPKVIQGVHDKKTAEQIYESVKSDIEPMALNVLETALNIAFPGFGSLLGIVVYLVQYVIIPEAEREFPKLEAAIVAIEKKL